MSAAPTATETAPVAATEVVPSASRWPRGWARDGGLLAAAAVALALAHGTLSRLGLDRAVSLFTLIALASAWNLVAGFGGLFSIGHAMFVGTGSYATTMLLIHTSLPMWLVLVLSALIAGGIGLVVALPLMRLRAAYFSVASLGIALAGQAWMTNWDYTGASTGLQMPVRRYLQPADQYWLALGVALVAVGSVLAMVRSGFGLRLMALRDDEEAAAEIGIQRTPIVLATWTFSAALVGLAGGVIAIQTSTVEPNSAFSFNHMLNMILSTVLGGIGTVFGPILGATLLYVVRLNLVDWKDWASFGLGVAIIATIRFIPGGVWGLALMGWRRFVQRR